LNERPHPYQQSSAYRYATLRSCRWCATVRGQVMRSNNPARTRSDALPYLRQGMPATRRRQGDGAAGWARQPHQRRDRNGGQAACPTRALRPARLVASIASPPASARPAAKPPREGMSQLGCPLGSGGAGAVGWSGVWPGMEKRSRASTRWRVASAAACCCAVTGRSRSVSAAWRSVASRRASLPSGVVVGLGRGRRWSGRRGAWLPA
jgi:hypothetical protein